MIRYPLAALLCATALTGLATPAAACIPGATVDGAPTLVCDTVRPSQLRSDVDDLRLIITPDGSIVPPSANAVDLRGDGQTLVNSGLVQGGGDSDAVRARGTGLTVENDGTLIGTDRGIRLVGGGGDFVLRNFEDGVISARRQAVRLDNELVLPNTFIENWGLIQSSEGRAIQSRGPGLTLVNHGTLRGGEEVVEGRLDFHLTNHGLIALNGLDWDAATRTWTDNGATVDEDGVQFSSGTVHNHGIILATDDGIDMDQGLVHNHATGVIVSAGDDTLRDSAAIDIDEVLQIPLVGGDETSEMPGLVRIVNEGYIEGPRAIAADLDAQQPIEIVNTGTLIGRSGVAIDLAPGQGDTTITLSDGSVVDGDILFGGGGTNTLVLGPFADGASFGGTVSARSASTVSLLSDGPDGRFDVTFMSGLGLSDVLRFDLDGDRVLLALTAGSGRIDFTLFGAEAFRFDGVGYDAAGFAALVSGAGVGVIPLPAGGWLLLSGLAALGLARRRSRVA